MCDAQFARGSIWSLRSGLPGRPGGDLAHTLRLRIRAPDDRDEGPLQGLASVTSIQSRPWDGTEFRTVRWGSRVRRALSVWRRGTSGASSTQAGIVQLAPMPEPSSLTLLASSFLSVLGLVWLRRRKAAVSKIGNADLKRTVARRRRTVLEMSSFLPPGGSAALDLFDLFRLKRCDLRFCQPALGEQTTKDIGEH